MRTRARAALALVIGAVLAGGCTQIVGPARTFRDFELKAATTAGSARSSVETARVALRLAQDDDAFAPYLSVLASEAEGAAAGAHATFEGIQPPDRRADALRERLTSILERADDALSEVRIRARRTALGSDQGALPERLARISRALDRFEKVHG